MKTYQYLPAITVVAFFGLVGIPQNASALTCNAGSCTILEDTSTVPFDNVPSFPPNGGFTGTAGIRTGSLANTWTSPFGDTTSPYLSIQHNSSATYNLSSPATGGGLFWGTPDDFNQIELFSGGTGGALVASLTGADLILSPHNGTGHDLVTILLTGGTFDTIRFSDISLTANAFELSNLSATPIPGTLALFASGLGVLGFVARSNRQKKKLATAGA
jgi:hypothetical protein